MSDANKQGRGVVAELRALLEKATPGPWSDAFCWSGYDGDHYRVSHQADGLNKGATFRIADMDGTEGNNKNNATLIAALRNAAPDLLRVVEAAREVARCCFEEYECSRNTDPANDDEYTTMMRPLWNELRVALEAVK